MKKLIVILILLFCTIGFSQPIGPPMTNERAEDLVGAMLTGVETLISVGYDDVNGLLDFVVDEASIDHDALTNFDVNEHIDWTGASAGTIDATNIEDKFLRNDGDDTTSGILTMAGLIVDTDTIYVDDVNNRVGIGTTNLTYAQFEIYKKQDATTMMLVWNDDTGGYANTTVAVGQSLSSSNWMRYGVLGTGYTTSGGYVQDGGYMVAESGLSGGLSLMARHGSATMRFYTAGSAAGNERMRIDETGKVGIGRTAPTAALDVNGGIVATGLTISTTGEINFRDTDISIGSTLFDGTLDISADISIDMFYDNADVGDGVDGQSLNINRRAAEGDNHISLYVDKDRKGLIGFSGDDDLLQLAANALTVNGTVTVTGNLSMGNDALIAVDVDSGLTASTTQTQGQGALTAQANEISTVANDNDTVTLPSAVTGIEIEIINNGANTLRIYPASGDDLGLGVNTFEELEANERVAFVAYDTTNWAKASSTEIIHAEIHDEDNTDAFVINDAGADFHSYHTNGLAAGDLADWTFDAGGAGTSFPIASIADGVDSGTDIEVTTTGNHLLEVGDIISQTNLADVNYVGIFDVKAIISATEYEVAAPYTADGTGTVDQAATLEADAVAAGVYSFAYCISAKPVGANETFDFQLHKEATTIIGSKVRRKFGAGGDYGSMSGCGVVAVADGDKISLAISNENSNANLTVRNLTIVLIRL